MYDVPVVGKQNSYGTSGRRVPNEVNIDNLLNNGKQINLQYQSGAKLEVHHSEPNLLAYEEAKEGPELDSSTQNLVDLREYLGAMHSIDDAQQAEAHRQAERMGTMKNERKKKKKKDKDGKKSKQGRRKEREIIQEEPQEEEKQE